jgi:hypothetical protein
MPMDAGPTIATQLRESRAALRALRGVVPARRRERDVLQVAWDRLVVRLADAQADIEVAKRELEATHDRLADLAVNAYTQGTPARMSAAVSSLLTADDVVGASRDLLLIEQYGAQEQDLATQYERQKRELERDVRVMEQQRVDVRGRLDVAIAAYDDAVRARDDARAQYAQAQVDLVRFHQLAVNSASPILGPNRLTAEDLAAFVRASGHRPQLSVPIEDLARMFIEESAAEGVRGDVAWAQSILETGWFGYKGSMVERHDNNFAGIGACDSCSRGLVFPDARTGVRAQVQGLKIYVDDEYGPRTAAHDIIRPGMLRLGFRGEVQSWWDLSGTWATARGYGRRVYDIYLQMVEHASTRAR